MVLGDLGADVVKVEKPGSGDDTRAWAPLTPSGESAMFLAANRNKRSIAVDLDHPDGAAIVAELAARADVFVESFRPGSLERRGLDADALRRANPRLVYCSISAFGHEGPRKNEAGYDPVIQAASGMMSITGEPDGPPVRLGISPADLGAGVWAVVGILNALIQRERTGEGCLVTTSLFETATWWLSYHLVGFLAAGAAPRRWGSASPSIAPYEVFPTADGDLFVAAANDRLFRLLADTLGIPGVADDPRFATNPSRVENVVELRGVIRRQLALRPAREWEALLRSKAIPCSPVASVADFSADPQMNALELLAPVGDPDLERLRLVAPPVAYDGRRAVEATRPPGLGEHTSAVLAELGKSETDVADLRSRGVVA